MNYKLALTIPAKPPGDNFTTIPLNLDSAGLGLVAVGLISLIISILKSSKSAWDASQEIIDDLKKHNNEKDDIIADLKAEILLNQRQIRTYQRVINLAEGTEPSNPPSPISQRF